MRRVVCFLVLTAAAGCGGKELLVPVRGRLTLDGQPLAGVVVTFTPVGDTLGNGSVGGTDADGRFTLTDVRGQAGAYVGAYRVSLYPTATGAKPGSPADVVSRGAGVPAAFLDPNHTPLRAAVPAGGGSVEILLTASVRESTTKTTPGAPGG